MEELIFENKKYISTRRAAVLLKCTNDYAGKLARQGKISAIRHKNFWFIEEEAVANYVRESTLQKELQRKELAKQREIEYRTRQELLKKTEKELAVSAASVPSVFSMAKSLMVTACVVVAFALKFLAGNVAFADTGIIEMAQHVVRAATENATQVLVAAEQAVASVGNSVLGSARAMSDVTVASAISLHNTGANILSGYERAIYAVARDAQFVGESYVAGINSTGDGIYSAFETVGEKRLAFVDRVHQGVDTNMAQASASLSFAHNKISTTYYGGLASISATLRSLVDTYTEGVYAVGQSVIEIGRAYNRGVYVVADKITGIVDDQYYASQLATHQPTVTEKPKTTVAVESDTETKKAPPTVSNQSSIVVRGISEEYLERRLAIFRESLDLKSEVTVIRETIEGSRISTDRIYDDISESSSEAAEDAVTGGDLSFNGIDGTFSGDVSVAGTTTLSGPLIVGGSSGDVGYVLQSTGDGAVWVATSTLGISGGGAGTWGSITGTLSDQTDLQTALDAKLSTTTAASIYVAQALTLNTLALTGNQTFATGTAGTDFNISSVAGVHTFNIPNASGSARGLLTSADWTTFNNKLSANSSIVGATKTKITYDASGLVTAGADATTADIADSLNRRYVTDTQLAVLGNTSGINTGDQTITLTGDVTGTGTGSFVATLANTGVSAGSYTNTNVTVDSKGRITAISNGAGGGGTWETLTGDQSTVNLSGFTDDVGFLTSESDPVYSGSSWFSTTNNASNWDTAYSWGDHSLEGYLTAESDPVYVASSWDTTTNNASNWDTAYGWGDHGTEGYAKLDASNQPFTGDLTVLKAEPRFTLDDSGDDAAFFFEKLSDDNKIRFVSQNRLYTPANAGTFSATTRATMTNSWSGNYSFSFWFKTSSTAQQRILYGGNSSNMLYLESNTLNFRPGTINGRTWNTPNASNNSWHHFVLTVNGSTVTLYYDGVALSPSLAGVMGGTFSQTLFNDASSGLAGSFDEFLFYTKELNSSEVTTLYGGGAPLQITSYTDVYAAYHLNELSGTTMTDSSGNGRNLSLSGTAPTWASGVVSAGVQPTSEIEFLSLLNNTTDNSYGTTQLGYRSGSYGTSNTYEGLTHRFNILGTQVLGLSSAAVSVTGTLTATSDITTSAGRVFSGSLGTAALPTFSLATDTDTGTWFPAADTFAISTGGTERLRVNSTGLGVGTTAPQTKVDVAGTVRSTAWTPATSGSGVEMGYYTLGGYGFIGTAVRPSSYGKLSVNDLLWVAPTGYTTGNVGIGVVTPATTLDILGGDLRAFQVLHSTTNLGRETAYFRNTNAAGQTAFTMENNRGSYASYGGFVYGGSTTVASNIFGVNRQDKLFMYADGASNLGMYVGTIQAQPFVIGTNNTERIRIDSAGKVGIGGTPSFPLDVAITTDSAQTYGYLNPSGTVGTSSGTNSYSIRAVGRILAPEFNAVSDGRLKNINFDLDSNLALDLIEQMRPVSFNWLAEPDGKPVLGFIAQDVQGIIPNAVSYIQGGVVENQLTLDYNQLTTVSIGAIKAIRESLGDSVDGMHYESIFTIETGFTSVVDIVTYINEQITSKTKALSDFVAVKITAMRAYVGDLFADKVTTNKLCIPDSNGVEVCLTGDELRELLGKEVSEDTDEGSDDTHSDGGSESDTPIDEEGSGTDDTGTDDAVTPDIDGGTGGDAGPTDDVTPDDSVTDTTDAPTDSETPDSGASDVGNSDSGANDTSDTGSDAGPTSAPDSGSDTSSDSSNDSGGTSDSSSDSGDSSPAPTE